ncbi:unnamed protein product [Clonostachys rosea]|uniref:Alginate lyase domain-containing protein n=1 Tax=Bionectria ochroleuca TaxID=29856 RepID=A0ABY6TX51_BIOOC|nr:unnamed protein product [Clonostachys rosea]
MPWLNLITLALIALPTLALPCCKSTLSAGFKHPGIYHDCDSLNRIQDNYQSGKAPYVKALDDAISRLPALQGDGTWDMDGPFETVAWAGDDGHNIPLMNDGKSAYALTLGWYATGNSTWLSRAKNVILSWGSTLKDLNDHIQGGEGLAYMTAAAEILRASEGSNWTNSDTNTYTQMIDRITGLWNETRGLVRPDLFLNQGAYGNSGAMAVAVFAGLQDIFDDMIYHATVGANPDSSIDYAIPLEISGKREYYGQVTEMGRDQGHPMGGLRALGFMGITSRIQGSTDFYTQNSSRLQAGWEYWCKYNSGEEVAYEPRAIRPNTSDEVWTAPNGKDRGRNFATYGTQPLEAIGVAFHEYYRRGTIKDMPYYDAYMKWQGVGWDAFEWGDDCTLGHLGFLEEA